MKFKTEITNLAKKSREASRVLANIPTKLKNQALLEMARLLIANKAFILTANKKDINLALGVSLSKPMVERLTLNDKRIAVMADSLRQIASLKDPVNEVIKSWDRPNGLRIKKVRVPIGVIAIIYESRPNVTSDCIGLCFKAGNCVILRGGSEAINSNIAIYSLLKRALKKYRIPEAAINLITTKDRAAVGALLKLNDYIDLVIPRGGESLIRKVVSVSRIPVIKHYKGICHIYVDEFADLAMARKICFNAKVQRPGVCNAMESMLVNAKVAEKFLPRMIKEFQDAGVEIRGCPMMKKFGAGIKLAVEKDYYTEYLDLILSVKVVGGVEEAIKHINNYGSHHSDSIITKNKHNAEEFLKRVDSACVYLNASTRFTDGYQFGMGAEIGISTDKLHARGPMALEELTAYKYEIFGNGQVRQ